MIIDYVKIELGWQLELDLGLDLKLGFRLELCWFAAIQRYIKVLVLGIVKFTEG